MATTGISTEGKFVLLAQGWTTKVAWARLYTNLDVLVDEQVLTLTHSFGTATMQPSADIVFDVAAGTNDVSYIIIGYTTPPADPLPELDHELYTKTLSTLYDFSTTGTLTVDSWVFTVGGTSITSDGIDTLCTAGLDGITSAILKTSALGILDTQSCTWSTSLATGIMTPTADIVFVVTSGTARYIDLVISSIVQYRRQLSTDYAFTTAGTLTVDSWAITL